MYQNILLKLGNKEEQKFLMGGGRIVRQNK